ncbi:MAG: hemerythrin domain-containing protein [Bdellovibrionota bacterium]
MKQTEVTKEKKSSDLQAVDIYDLILEEHKPLKQLIKILKDPEKPIEDRQAAYAEFAPMLISHAKPEEQTLYVYMKREDDTRIEALEGEIEHKLAEEMIGRIEKVDDPDLWTAKVKVLAELVEHHIKEEESEFLPDFKKETAKEERVNLGALYLKLKKQLQH